MPDLSLVPDPEYLVLAGGALWIACGALIGWRSPSRVPREFAPLFILLGVAGSGIGISIFLPDAQTEWIVLGSVLLYMLLPLLFTVYIFWIYPLREPPERPRGLGKRNERDDSS